MPRLASIQVLRGVAALGVAVFHAGQWSHVDLHLGAAGVDLFFVISGAIMWLVTAGPERRPGLFLARRALRIAPLYWLATLAVTAVALVVPLVAWDVRPTPEHVALSLAFIPHFNPAGLPFPALAQGWSLPYEVLFYGLFALALFLPRDRQFLSLALGLSALYVIGYANPPFYMLIGNSLLLEFVLGMGLARALLARALPPARWGVAWMVLGALGLGAGSLVGGDDPGNWRIVVWGLPAAAVVGGALTLEAAGRWPRMVWLERLGDASYALYLFNRLTATAVTVALAGAPLLAILPAAVLGAVAVGLALHHAVERPMLRGLRALAERAAPGGAAAQT